MKELNNNEERLKGFQDEKTTHHQETGEQSNSFIIEEKDIHENKATPTFFLGRELTKNIPSIGKSACGQIKEHEKNIFDVLTKERTKEVAIDENDYNARLEIAQKNYGRIFNRLSEDTINRTIFALGQLLYYSSKENGTIRKHIGTGRDQGYIVNNTGVAIPYTKEAGNIGVYSNIIFSLNELTKYAYGKYIGWQRKEIETTIEALRWVDIVWTDNNGDEITDSLIFRGRRIKRKADGAVFYCLLLHPIFSSLSKGAVEHPSNIMELLDNTEGGLFNQKLRLLTLLGNGDKRKEYNIEKRLLLQKLGWLEQFKKNKKRVSEYLEMLFKAMKDIGIILPEAPDGGSNPKETDSEKGERLYVFYLNPDYPERRPRKLK